MAEWWNERSLLRLVSDKFQDLEPHSRVLRGPATYVQYFTRWSTLLLVRTCLRIPSCADALLMRDLISASQVRSGVRIVPRYLKLFVKGIVLAPPFSVRGGGWVLSFICDVACDLVAGKYMASVIDFVFADPMCIWRPKRRKWSFVICAVVSASCLVVRRKALSST